MASTAHWLRVSWPVLVLASTLAAGLATGAQEDLLGDWQQRMATGEEDLRQERWQRAERSAALVLAEMLPRVGNEGDGPSLLATALYLRAAAAAGGGDEETALWHWWLAQNLDPELRHQQLPDLGAASALLERHRLRAAGAVPPGLPALPEAWDGSEYRPPVPRRVPYPDGDVARWSGDVGIELLVGPGGEVTQPVLVTSEGATLPQIYLQFMALRNWSYRPAAHRGEPVAVPYTVRKLRTPLSPLDNWLRMEVLRDLHDRLLDGAWEEAAAEAWELAGRAGSGFVLAGALSFAAVAEAERGDRRRALAALRTVESLIGSIHPQVPAYGDGARWLWRQRARCAHPFRWADVDGEDEPLDAVCSADPRTDRGLAPPRPLAPAPLSPAPLSPAPLAGLAELEADERVFVRLLVDDEGRVSEARMLAAASSDVAPGVLAAVQEWRFAPARRDGEAVPALYDAALEAPPAGDGVEDWRRRLEALEERAVAGDPADVLAAAARLQHDLEAGLVRGGSELLARALAARALAEAGLATAGEADDRLAAEARWHWHAAQSLAPQVGYLDLSPHGAAGALLAPYTPPRPLRAERYLVAASHQPPPAIERVAPAVGAAGGGLVEIEVSIDAAGRPHEPVWHSGGPPAHLSAALEALRGWRFAPPGEGAPERRRVVVQAAKGGEAAGRLSRHQRELMQGFRQQAGDDPIRAACLWTSLQSLAPELRRVDLSALAATPVEEELLHRHLVPPTSRWDWLPSGTAGPVWGGEDVVPPRKVHAPQPRYSAAARRHRVRGSIVLETIVGTDGRVHRAKVLRGLPHGLSERAVDAVCSWRFEPATRDGEPVEALYSVTLGFTLSDLR